MPDPTLPSTFDTSVPAHAADAADHTPSDAAALQSALNSAQAGEIIELTAGTVYEGHFTIPATTKGTAGNEIIIRSSGHASLPAYGNRVAESDSQYMATMRGRDLGGANARVLTVDEGSGGSAGASYIRFLGVDFTSANDSGIGGADFANLMVIGNAGRAYTEQPRNIIFDRCLVRGGAKTPCRNAMSLNVKEAAVKYCRFYEIHSNGENGGVCIIDYTGEGPTVIEDNYLEATGVPLFIGAQAPNSPPPLDVTIRRNEIVVPDDQIALGWGKKNKIEIKVGSRILIEKNVMTGGLSSDQSRNDAVYITSEGAGSVTEHVTVRSNKITNSQSTLSFETGGDGVRDVLFEENLAYGVGMVGQWVLGLGDRVTVRNSTFSKGTQSGTHHPSLAGSAGMADLIVKDNILDMGGNYPFKYTATTQGTASLNAFCDGPYSLLNNLIRGVLLGETRYNSGAESGSTAENNAFPATTADIGFVDADNDDYELDDASDYATASSTGGKPGCDVPTLNSLLTDGEVEDEPDGGGGGGGGGAAAGGKSPFPLVLFIGTYQQGDLLPLAVWSRTAAGIPRSPDAAPLAQVLGSSGDVVRSQKLPLVDQQRVTGYFRHQLHLGANFSAGRYTIVYTWEIDGTLEQQIQEFEILDSGNASGAGMAMHFFRQASADYLLLQDDSGKLNRLRQPEVRNA